MRAVFKELAQDRPAGFRYAVFQLPDSRLDLFDVDVGTVHRWLGVGDALDAVANA